MKVEQVLQLIEAVSASELTEFKYEEDGVKLSLKKTCDRIVPVQTVVPGTPGYTVAPASVTAPVSANPASANPAVPGTAQVSADAPAVPQAGGEAGNTENAGSAEVSGKVVKSPLVGTFYAAPAEDAEPFVKPGDSVKEGQVLAIVEAMKLMNEIESDFTGTVKEVLVENGQAVEYGQPLFVIG